MASNHRSKRKAADNTGSRFYLAKVPEIDRRFAGKHIAIISDRVIASGRRPLDVYKRAKRAYPNGRPLLAYIPKNLISFQQRLQKQAVPKKRVREAAERIKKIRERSGSPGWNGVREIRRWRDARHQPQRQEVR